MPKKKITTEERELKIFYPKWMEDLPFPELLSYKNLVVKPETLKDINKSEGVKLTGIEEGAMNLANHTTDDLSQGLTNKYDDQDASNRAKAGLTTAGYVAKELKGTVLPATIPNEAGLMVTQNYMGYKTSGTTVDAWKSYIGSDGTFYFNKGGSNYIQWDGVNLIVRGNIYNTGGQINADYITAGTLTGRKVQTASSGDRISLEITESLFPHQLLFYKSDTLTGRIFVTSGALNIQSYQSGSAVIIGTLDGLSLYIYGTGIYTKHLRPQSDNTYYLGSSSYWWKRLYLSELMVFPYNNIGAIQHGDYILFRFPASSTQIDVGGSMIPLSSHNLGSSTYYWNNLYLNNLRFNPNYGRIYWGADLWMDIYNAYVNMGKHLYPVSSAAQITLGSSNKYYHEVNSVYFTKRGGFGVFDEGVELQDGRKVSDLEAILNLKPHPKMKSQYGVPRVDPKTLPKVVLKPKESKDGEDGEELGAMISIILGAIKELNKKYEEMAKKINH